MSPQLDTIALGHDAQTLNQALQWLGAIAERDHWPGDVVFRLTLGLEEALANVMKHAFSESTAASSETPRIRLHCHRDEARIALTLQDNGTPFDPTAQAVAALPTSVCDAAISGHGLRLMRHYLSSLSYRRVANENCLTMTLRVDPPGSATNMS